MPDRDKIINCLTCVEQIMVCRQEICPLEDLQYWIELQEGVSDAIALLKSDCHNCKLECLLQKYDELKEKYDALLKEQEAQRDYEASVEMAEYCERYEQTYNPEDGSM